LRLSKNAKQFATIGERSFLIHPILWAHELPPPTGQF
jgi:hypothetical protein